MLPTVATDEDFAAIRRDEALLRPGVDAILARHRVSGEVARFVAGSMPVYAVGEHRVLKLYAPPYLAERATETAALAAVDGKLSIPTPRVEASGELDGWGYVLMDRMHGESLATAWPQLDDQARTHLMSQLGEAIAALHAIDVPLGLDDWDAFVQTQRASAVERQRKKGLAEVWLAQIPAFLASVELPAPRHGLLHTEIMREHLLVRDGRLSGLFDFEPAMRGAPEYDFAAVGVFVTCGQPRDLHTLLRAYGYREDELDDALARRLLAYALLHRYSHLRWYLERLPPTDAPTLDVLARHGWGTRR